MDKIYIVMDYVEHDLKSLMETMTQPFLIGMNFVLIHNIAWIKYLSPWFWGSWWPIFKTINNFPTNGIKYFFGGKIINWFCYRSKISPPTEFLIFLVGKFCGGGPKHGLNPLNHCNPCLGEVKTLMLHLLRGIRHLHDNWILHRDIKASNLLLSHKGILKVKFVKFM